MVKAWPAPRSLALALAAAEMPVLAETTVPLTILPVLAILPVLTILPVLAVLAILSGRCGVHNQREGEPDHRAEGDPALHWALFLAPDAAATRFSNNSSAVFFWAGDRTL